MSDTIENLKQAVDMVKIAHQDVFDANTGLSLAQAELESAKTNAILNGLEGKNETARKGEIAVITEMEARAVVEAQAAVAQADLQLKLAEIDLRLAYALSSKENADANRALAAELLNVHH